MVFEKKIVVPDNQPGQFCISSLLKQTQQQILLLPHPDLSPAVVYIYLTSLLEFRMVA